VVGKTTTTPGWSKLIGDTRSPFNVTTVDWRGIGVGSRSVVAFSRLFMRRWSAMSFSMSHVFVAARMRRRRWLHGNYFVHGCLFHQSLAFLPCMQTFIGLIQTLSFSRSDIMVIKKLSKHNICIQYTDCFWAACHSHKMHKTVVINKRWWKNPSCSESITMFV